MKNQLDKAKKLARKYRYEIVLVGTGVVIGHKMAKRGYVKDVDRLVDQINANLEAAFAEVEGNFSAKGGGYFIPLLDKG